ncbi:MAG: tyrosine-type recombinase/integrase [Peptoanaerobacter stomatis]|uniref:tyrosine-type recombinase/integrase n=1 Tax=Peptoanaerobacter stomatis TaxID=796937 RepID=UPI003FA02B75
MGNEIERSKRLEFDYKIEDTVNFNSLMLLKKYLNNLNMKNLSSKTIYNYERDIMQWFVYIKEYQDDIDIINTLKDKNTGEIVKCIETDDIEEFIVYCQQHGNNVNRIKRRCASISAFYKFLKRKKLYIGDNPVDNIERPKGNRAVVVQTYLTVGQVAKIREYLANQPNGQLELFFEVGLATMGRVNALSNLKFSDCDFEQMCFRDILEKEGKIVNLFFTEKVRDLLLEWKQLRYNSGITNDYIFITKGNNGVWSRAGVRTLQTWIGKIGLDAIGIKLHPHDLRHSGATLLKNAGMPLEDISSLLNHESTDVTKKFYIKSDDKKLGEIYRQYSI